MCKVKHYLLVPLEQVYLHKITRRACYQAFAALLVKQEQGLEDTEQASCAPPGNPPPLNSQRVKREQRSHCSALTCSLYVLVPFSVLITRFCCGRNGILQTQKASLEIIRARA